MPLSFYKNFVSIFLFFFSNIVIKKIRNSLFFKKLNKNFGKKSAEEITKDKIDAEKKAGKLQVMLLIIGALITWFIGIYAPADFMQHFIVFILSCFVGYQVIWNVSHSLHTPLMAVTNAISSIIIIGALLQMKTDNDIVSILALVSIFIATINIVGGFMVTKRMLAMFQRS